MRVVFMGTPEAAVPSLRALARADEVVAVYTRRDRPRGRGLRSAPSAVKLAAEELGLSVVQPKTLRGEAPALQARRPDVVVVVAYGMLLPPEVLAVPRLGCVNVHFSLLPRWRGAAPVERAVLAGDGRTGVTTMLMDEGLDTGPILHQEPTDIRSDDTAGSLTSGLASMGAELVVRTLRDLDAGAVTPRPQPDEGVTIASRIEPEQAQMDPSRAAVELERVVRAMDPAPGAFLWFRGRRLKVWRARVVAGDGTVGVITEAGPEAVDVQTADGRLRLEEVQPEGKRRMLAADFARGYRPQAGEPVGPGAKGADGGGV